MAFQSFKHLFFGLEPVIDFRARLIAALDIEFVGTTADEFFERKRLDRGFPCFRRCRLGSPPANKITQPMPGRKGAPIQCWTSRGEALTGAISKRLRWFRFLFNLALDFWAEDRLAAVLAELSHHVRFDRVIGSAMSAMEHGHISCSSAATVSPRMPARYSTPRRRVSYQSTMAFLAWLP